MVLLRTYLTLCVATLLGTYASALESSNSSDLLPISTSIQKGLGLEKTQLIYYERSATGSVSYNFSVQKSEELMKHTDSRKPYVFYIHGTNQDSNSISVQTIVSSHLQRGADNFIQFDWSGFAFNDYVGVVAPNIKLVSKLAAEAISKLVANGLDPNTLHVLGESSGSQIAGFIGQYLDFTIPRVTGLDPSNPVDAEWGPEHLDETSGRQVDIIHTDSGMLGAYGRTGSIDFFANGGNRPQPGCDHFGQLEEDGDLCSHWRSWRFYAESVVNETAFPAIECDSYMAFLRGDCEGNRIVYFGYAMPANATGIYYFNTNKESPYGKGLAGVNPMSN